MIEIFRLQSEEKTVVVTFLDGWYTATVNEGKAIKSLRSRDSKKVATWAENQFKK